MTKASAMAVLRSGPKIEGGLDAIVIGDAPDGLAAAGLMARSGLGVMVIERGLAGSRERREFSPGYFCDDGDPIAGAIDSDVADGLDLYRHGLAFARRRLETLVRFGDRAALIFGGDPAAMPEAAAAMSEADADRFRDTIEGLFNEARRLGPWFADAERAIAPDADDLSASLDQRLAGRFADARLEDYLRAEALMGAGARPTDPFGWLALVQRWAGDAAGLQGGLAAIEGGERALVAALRRSCQSLGVVFRQTERISGAVVEWDRVEGLALDDGGQIRASIVVSALGAHDSFIGLISRSRLDIEFANFLSAPAPRLGPVRAHIALEGGIDDEVIASKPDRRLFYAPTAGEIHPAWRLALEGGAGGPLTAEAIITSALDPTLAPTGFTAISMLLHPVGLHALDDEATRKAVDKAVAATLERLVPGAAAKIIAIDYETPAPAAAPIGVAAARRRIYAEAAGLDGFFFCGPEARLGGRLSLCAGRRAAERAIAYAKIRGSAR